MYSVGDNFPNFSMQGVNDTNDIVDCDVLLNEWTVMYFYPKDFTFICPTEIVAMDNLTECADVIGVSGDNEFCKIAWKNSDPVLNSIQHILCADSGLTLGTELGIVDKSNGVHYRATYIIDPKGVIQHVSVNALDTGRNANEILRTVQALQSEGLTGCSWQPGDDFVG